MVRPGIGSLPRENLPSFQQGSSPTPPLLHHQCEDCPPSTESLTQLSAPRNTVHSHSRRSTKHTHDDSTRALCALPEAREDTMSRRGDPAGLVLRQSHTAEYSAAIKSNEAPRRKLMHDDHQASASG